MKAALYHRYGPLDVVQWQETEVPRVRGREVLVQVEAAALNPKDVVLRSGKFRVLSGAGFPKQLGHDFVGRVVARGWRVSQALEGQRVFGFFSGFRARRGAVAEMTSISADQIAPISSAVDAIAAAATPLAGSTALQALRDDARLVALEHVLIVGASGGVGTFAVQVAKLLGARVSASASARNGELVRGLGADEVLDHGAAAPLGSGPYDVVLDCYGKLRLRHVADVLKPAGRFVSLVPSREIAWNTVVAAVSGRRRVRLTSVRPRVRDLLELARWLEQGRLRPVIDRVYAPEEVHEAMRHLETRHARGKLVIRVA